MSRALLAATLAVAFVAPAVARAEGPMVLVGGSLRDHRIYQEIVRLGGTRPRVAIVTAASESDEKNGRYYEEQFLRHGASSAGWIDLRARDAPRRLREADIIFFGGGDQSRLLSRLQDDRALIDAITEAHDRGAVMAGTSAGTAVMPSGPMITGNGPTWTPRGLGLFRHGLLDTHFSERDRQDRLVELARRTGTRVAFGVDENTALVVERGRMRVIGKNTVTQYDVGARVTTRVLRAGTPSAPLR
jgi:cyanophycinase